MNRYQAVYQGDDYNDKNKCGEIRTSVGFVYPGLDFNVQIPLSCFKYQNGDFFVSLPSNSPLTVTASYLNFTYIALNQVQFLEKYSTKLYRHTIQQNYQWKIGH